VSVVSGLKQKIIYKIWQDRTSYFFLMPFAIIFFTFTVLPVVISLYYSFTYNNIFEAVRWVGFENYIRLFTRDQVFVKALQNTLSFALVIGPGGYILAFTIAWFINELPNKFRTLFVLIFYSPTIAGSVFIIFTLLFSGDVYGYVNGILINIGIITDPIEWLINPRYMNSVLIICVLWSSMGAGFLSFVAGFKNIDKQYYEAAAIDGMRNRWQELWFVTLPMMKPMLLFGAVMSITSAFSIHEVTIALFNFPSTNYEAHTIVNHLWDYGYMRFEMGYASAIATILFILMLFSRSLINRLIERVGR